MLAVGYRSASALEELLKACSVTYHITGGARKPGNLKDAITQGYETAREL